jgi:ABC-type phosphate/phosphonate transport system substrate-binding protein
MRRSRVFTTLALAVLAILAGAVFAPGSAHAAPFRIAIMQDSPEMARQYQPVLNYLRARGVEASYVSTRDYTEAALMFADGKVDAMFSGSGIAGTLIIKGLARPIVRPLAKDGTSTYHAVVVARRGAQRFTGEAGYFQGKRVTFCALASSGEFFFRSIDGAVGAAAKTITAPTHGDALAALSRGMADIAIVKNLVWDAQQARYPDLVRVGGDMGENPNNALVVSRKTDSALANEIKGLLLALGDETSAEAEEVRESLGITRFIETSVSDFSHTIPMLRAAGVNAHFPFKY